MAESAAVTTQPARAILSIAEHLRWPSAGTTIPATRISAPMLPFTEKGSHNPEATLVLLHVFGGSRREWTEVGDLLASEFRTIAIDTPGFGDAHNVEGYSVAEMARHFADTITALKLQRYILVGHSMTGKVSAVLTRLAPKFGLPAPEKLVLLTPSPLSPEPMPDAARKQMSEHHGDRASGEKYLADNIRLPIPPAIFERALEDYLRANPAAWMAWLTGGSYEDWVSRAAPIATETLVIAAEHDPALTTEVQQRVTMPNLEHGRLMTIEGSGHMVPIEAPERLATLLRNFARTP